MKIAEWAENQRFGGKGAQLQYPIWTKNEEPELELFGFGQFHKIEINLN